MEPKTIIVFCSIFLIFALALLIPHVRKAHSDPFRLVEPDDLLDEIMGEEGHVTYTHL